ncbi:hypothetical protein HYX13_01595 [Candidatus Woesearchaeota archaeon]|nr:hypothetical protein [Candidatus Woesearchaeota archaeon]
MANISVKVSGPLGLIAFGAGAYHGFMDGQGLPLPKENLENILTYGPTMASGALGGLVGGMIGLVGGAAVGGSEYGAKGAAAGGVVGAASIGIVAGSLGTVSGALGTLIGYGCGYATGYLLK